MSALLDAIVPPGMRSHVWRLVEWPERIRFRRRLKALVLTPSLGSPALNYGDALTPDNAGLVHGGRVKLLHLAEQFPPVKDFNLLYLVSSAPPKFALELVTWARTGVARRVADPKKSKASQGFLLFMWLSP